MNLGNFDIHAPARPLPKTMNEDLFMLRPDLVQPLGTQKAIANLPTDIPVDMNQMFLSDRNILLLLEGLYLTYTQNGGKHGKQKFAAFVQSMAKNFVQTNNLHAYEIAEFEAIGYNDHVECLRAINLDFTKECYKYFKWNDFNFQQRYEVGKHEKRVLKKGYEFDHTDHGTLDLWRQTSTMSLNRNFRDQNRIPPHRAHAQVRHYDRGNEGLRENNPNRASLDGQIHGYDMSSIYNQLGNYSKEKWYSMRGA